MTAPPGGATVARSRLRLRPRRVRHVLSTNGQVPIDMTAEPVSGVVGVALSLAMTQVERGLEAELTGWRGGAPTRTQIKGVRVTTHPGWRYLRFAHWDLRWLAPMALQALVDRDVDVLHVHVEPNLLLLPRAHARVLHLHTPVAVSLPAAYQRLLRRADAVICCSHFLRDQFMRATDYPAERVFVVHNAADLRRFDQVDGRGLRARWGYDPDDVVILYAGAVVPQKGVLYAIRAVQQLRARYPNVHLVVAGASALWLGLDSPITDPALHSYEAEVSRMSQNGVNYLGVRPRQEMPSLFKAADVVVVPSVWSEPHATVLCEAMAAGRPLVASAIGGMPETVIDGETGFLVPPGDPEPLCEALGRLVESAALRRQMGERARTYAAEYLNWERAAVQLDAIYDQVLGADR